MTKWEKVYRFRGRILRDYSTQNLEINTCNYSLGQVGKNHEVATKEIKSIQRRRIRKGY
jgi:hypothetical protein